MSNLSFNFRHFSHSIFFLVVPSTSVHYDEKKEKELQFEAKLKRLQKAEEAKQLKSQNQDNADQASSNDGFVQRLLATIIKNLEVTVTKVHIRFEDKQIKAISNGYPFAAGVTLGRLVMTTTSADQEEKGTLKVFGKQVTLEAFAVYWKPREKLIFSDNFSVLEHIDSMFDKNIWTLENQSPRLKYLIGKFQGLICEYKVLRSSDFFSRPHFFACQNAMVSKS